MTSIEEEEAEMLHEKQVEEENQENFCN